MLPPATRQMSDVDEHPFIVAGSASNSAESQLISSRAPSINNSSIDISKIARLPPASELHCVIGKDQHSVDTHSQCGGRTDPPFNASIIAAPVTIDKFHSKCGQITENL